MSNNISIVIPAYNRVIELAELFDSILLQSTYPDSVIICEDVSPERENIKALCDSYHERFTNVGIEFRLVFNEVNLGYDKNLRKCIHLANTEWALLMGNDDVLLPNCIQTIKNFVSKSEFNSVKLISRTFFRFNNSISAPLGKSSLFEHDCIIDKKMSPKYIFRSAGFVGGLIVNTAFAKAYETEQYDGSLYYQIYLSALAYCNNGIGYIATPIIGGRADNPPMFGQSADDSDVHIPGSYSAKGRAKMWKGVLDIATDIGNLYNIDLYGPIQYELSVRQAFHIFEMNAGQNHDKLKELRIELSKLCLFNHPFPVALYMLNIVFGKKAKGIYSLARKFMQQ